MQKTDSAKGIVDPAGAARKIRLATYPPPAQLAPFIDYFWLVKWDLSGQPSQMQRVLPYPNAHMVFECGKSAIHGVVRGTFDRHLEGAGQVLGIRFRPGALRPFITRSVATLTDRTVAIDEVLGMGTGKAERLVLQHAGDAAMVDAASALLAAVLPAQDPRAVQVEQAVKMAEAAGGPVSVAALAAQTGLQERTLQRMFLEYVGVSPKWVIQRYRLQEALWLLGQADAPDLSALAAHLGFFDQAHFTRSFTSLVGQSPLAYWRSQQ